MKFKCLVIFLKHDYIRNGKKAVMEEIEALKENKNKEMVELLEGKKINVSKWMFIVKYRLDGTMERFTALKSMELTMKKPSPQWQN